METEKRIIEINGIKMEVDLRDAKIIDQYKVGDTIKVLVKEYSGSYKSYLGVIIGFDNFEKTPTVVIAYVKTNYNEATIEFIYFNDKTKDVEITGINSFDTPITKIEVLRKFDDEITKKEEELRNIHTKKRIFEELFGKYFKSIE